MVKLNDYQLEQQQEQERLGQISSQLEHKYPYLSRAIRDHAEHLDSLLSDASDLGEMLNQINTLREICNERMELALWAASISGQKPSHRKAAAREIEPVVS